MKTTLAILLLLLSILPAQGQKEGNIWYFGFGAGLDFNGGDPVALTDGKLTTSEGCASLADKDGNLLFYTDGINVWDRQHTIMPNGTGLFGDPSSTQSGVIVPYPGHEGKFFIFTVASNGGPNGFCYSELDLNLNNGYGDINSKNNQLYPNSTEKITAIQHRNNRDFWVISHKLKEAEFVAYLISEQGISKTPVISKTGISYAGGAIGQMTASSDGSKLAAAAWSLGKVQLYDLDNATGVISNPLELPSGSYEYGVAFSPDNSKLYFASWSNSGSSTIHQFDLKAGDTTAVKASRTLIYTGQIFASMQLGSNGRIYVACFNQMYLGVINEPNAKGPACDFKLEGVDLNGFKSSGGLPTIIQSYFEPKDIVITGSCTGRPVSFALRNGAKVDSVNWDFGDPGSGIANYSTSFSPTHIYTQKGIYQVGLQYYIKGNKFSTSRQLEIFPLPEAQLPADTIICPAAPITIIPIKAEALSYRWSTGDSSKSITVAGPGSYWLEVSNGICIARDSILITAFDPGMLDLGEDTLLCEGNTLRLSPGMPGDYIWSDGTVSNSMLVTKENAYWVEITNPCGKFTDTIHITGGCECHLYIPNAFTPNHDKLNELYKPGLCPTRDYYFAIYNRWGERIYETEKIEEGWDGSFKGSTAPEGMYIYMIKAQGVDWKQYYSSGRFYLLR